jgi:hypothetical protein
VTYNATDVPNPVNVVVGVVKWVGSAIVDNRNIVRQISFNAPFVAQRENPSFGDAKPEETAITVATSPIKAILSPNSK